MKRSFVIAFVIFVFSVSLVSAAWAVPQTVTLTSVKGEVSVQKETDTEWSPVKEGMEVSSGDAIKTGPGSSVTIKFEDSGTLAIREKTDVRVIRAEIEDKIAKTEVSMHLGKLRAKIQRLEPGANFDVKTPVSVATVRGSSYDLWVYLAQNQIFAQLDVLGGNIFYGNLDGSMGFLVGQGQSSTANQQGQVSTPQNTGGGGTDQSLGAAGSGGSTSSEFGQTGAGGGNGTTGDFQGYGGQQGYNQQTLGAQDSAGGLPSGLVSEEESDNGGCSM